MSCAKSPNLSEVEGFLSEARAGRAEDEPDDALLKRTLKQLVLAHTQARVAEALAVKEVSVAKPLRPEVSPQLGTICRIANAVGCEVTLVARAAQFPGHAAPE